MRTFLSKQDEEDISNYIREEVDKKYMSLVDDVKKAKTENSPFFQAEVLKEYTFKILSYSIIGADHKFYKEDQTTFEFTLLDEINNKEKTWTTASQDVFDAIVDQKIEVGDTIKVKKTGEVGKGKKFWDIKKLEIKADA